MKTLKCPSCDRDLPPRGGKLPPHAKKAGRQRLCADSGLSVADAKYEAKLKAAAERAKANGLPPLRAHDVRRLVCCTLCKGPGLPEDLLQVAVLHEHDVKPFHVECFAAWGDEEDLLGLPVEERRKVRIGQVKPSTFKKLLKLEKEETP